MQEFTAYEYVLIDIANQMGYDKWTWQDRINWTETNESKLESFTKQADDKYLYIKAVNALRDAQAGIPTGYILGLDCTASGLQIMASLVGCKKTAKAVNLIDNGKRNDVYTEVGKTMGVDRSEIKDPLMTTFYGSTAEPEYAFGEGTKKLRKYYKALHKKLPGAMDCLGIIQDCWDPKAYAYDWDMPDQHHVHMKVFDNLDKKIEIDELKHRTFTYRTKINRPLKKSRSLAANVVHSVDGYLAREIIRRCAKEDVQVSAIHDSFWTYPGDMNIVRRHAIAIMAEIADSDLLQDILRQITNNPFLEIEKDSENLSKKIRKCEYLLS